MDLQPLATLLAIPWVLVTSSALLGLLVGSFLNVVIHRLPKMMEHEWLCQCAEFRGEPVPTNESVSLVSPRSRCPQCGHAISALENIPLLSWVFLGGKCAGCNAPISPRYPLVEAITGIISASAAAYFGFGWALAGALLLCWSLIALTFIDAETQLLPDSITLPLLWAGLGFNLSGTFTDLPSAVIGAMAGYLALWSVYWAFKLVTGKEGMGYGDFKLLAALGAWLGWQMLPLIILLSSLVGAIVGVALIVLARRGRQVPIPFGPYLATAGLIALIWGKMLTQAYLRMI
ncbi:prepilin peptidase [Propionivibrio dicarboxylicus]|uniref:Prepilin leader peptidase/N-methyltransferase n=1 Tax=Propionivibrio dicarboxylicus TaxID=83767 RepID=A0A1G8IPL6_9RHOO|nr:A24 family peptidase [Propionivibrio dicarboxylicus]SDI20460.1 leader peptidase (prepilin peptidase) / N-methyltransferase [Propionivibrio dicarboxylicus]